jgi:ribonuclease D
LLPDSAIIAAARANPSGPAELTQLPTFRGPRQRRAIGRWWNAVAEALALPDDDLPQLVGRTDAMPPTSRWRERDPQAAARLAACRHVVSTLAAQHRVLPQNLLAGDIVRRLAWEPPDPPDRSGVGTALARFGARPWQIGLTAQALSDALRAANAAEPSP